MKYTHSTIHRFWSDEFKKLPFTRQPIMDSEIQHWISKGYYHSSFSGEMYDNRNPMPAFIEVIGDQFNLKDKTFTIYRMNTLDIMPAHIDHFQRYSSLFCSDVTRIKRAVVMLEDWKPGHYFEIDKTCVTNWRAGDYFLWDHDVEHAAANIGVEPRYTLQITGHV